MAAIHSFLALTQAEYDAIQTLLQACGVLFPLASPTSTCRSSVTICSGLYFLIGIPLPFLSHSRWYKNPGQVKTETGKRGMVLRKCIEFCQWNKESIRDAW